MWLCVSLVCLVVCLYCVPSGVFVLCVRLRGIVCLWCVCVCGVQVYVCMYCIRVRVYYIHGRC